MSHKPLVYLAAPLFNERERSFNEALAYLLAPFVDVFLPQRDGVLLTGLLAEGLSTEDAYKRIYTKDCAALSKADALIAVLDGAHIDEGVAFEVGYMCALGRPCVGFQSDTRRSLPSGNNPIIQMGLRQIFATRDDLAVWAKGFVAYA